MILRILATVLVLCTLTLSAQALPGEIAGRISDEHHSGTPGARVRITNGAVSAETETDSEGRFVFRSLALGTYRVRVDLPGFRVASGDIAISRSTPRAFLAWSLELGCLAEVQRVVLEPRDAARLVEAIVHVRVDAVLGSAVMSVDPDCRGDVLEEYTVRTLGAVAGRAGSGSGPRHIFLDRRDARLSLGHEYLALLWPNGITTSELILPIVSGEVASPGAGELNGLRAQEALNLLSKWSQERQR